MILDEGHNPRHDKTKRFKSVDLVRPEWIWFLTGTPIINNVKDTLGPLKFLWPRIEAEIAKDDSIKDWPAQANSVGLSLRNRLKACPADDKNRLLALNPDTLGHLLDTGNITLIQQFCHIADKLYAIRRSQASNLMNSNGASISLKSIMPSHDIKTISLEYSKVHAKVYAYFHRAHVQDYPQAIQMLYKSKEERKMIYEPQGHSSHVMSALRGMTVLTTSALLARFEALMKQASKKWDTRVDSINHYRSIGLSVHHFIAITHRKGDPPIDTAKERAAFMGWGSAKVPILYGFLAKFAVPLDEAAGVDKRSKLLITDEFPASAWFIQLCCEAVGVTCEVLHSDLPGSERIKLIRNFNDATTKVRVLVILYGVDLMGVNLDGCCWNVLVWTAATNAAVEAQATARPIRVSFLNPCYS